MNLTKHKVHRTSLCPWFKQLHETTIFPSLSLQKRNARNEDGGASGGEVWALRTTWGVTSFPVFFQMTLWHLRDMVWWCHIMHPSLFVYVWGIPTTAGLRPWQRFLGSIEHAGGLVGYNLLVNSIDWCPVWKGWVCFEIQLQSPSPQSYLNLATSYH